MAGSRIAQNAQLKLSTQSTQSSPTRATRSRRGRQGRLRRWGRRLGIALLALLVVIGAVSVWRFVAGPPGVGHFADAEARGEVGQDAHGRELGHADGEAAHGQGQQDQGHLAGGGDALDCGRRRTNAVVDTGGGVGGGHILSQCNKLYAASQNRA